VYPVEPSPYIQGSATSFAVVDSPVVRKAVVDSLVVRRVAEVVDNLIVHKPVEAVNTHLAVHKAVVIVDSLVVRRIEMDIVPVVDYKVGTDIEFEADYSRAGMDVEPEIAHKVETDIEADYKVGMDFGDMAVENWYIGLIGNCMKVVHTDLCLLMCCHNHRKNVHSLRFVSRIWCNAQWLFVPVPQHVYHDHTGYKTSLPLGFEHSRLGKNLALEDLAASEISTWPHNVYKRPHSFLLHHDNLGR
jgi:hypothetical protein